MDKRVIFAVAGAGKTTHIVNQLQEDTKALIVTYTNNNLYNLRKKIKEKFNYLPENIRVVSYFSFVYSFCFRPFLLNELRATGILYEPNPNTFARKGQDRYFLSPSRRLYSNRIALLVQEKKLMDDIRSRLSKYYEFFVVDEVQDLSAHDFNLLMEVVKADVATLLVGDYYQYTYDTSRDGNVRKNLHKDFSDYKEEYRKSGLKIDETSLIKSYRCSSNTCRFVNEMLGIVIESHSSNATEIRELTDDEIENIVKDKDTIKLFYQKSYAYNMNSRNWGDSKGEDRYFDVCIVLNPNTYRLFSQNKLNTLKPTTKNKLYVAITRARGNVYFVDQNKLECYKKGL